ncbi:hypothetical protein DPEC_G00158620 [Dallia pectoralis]|uniref:Uncharacterized protein n=1 Tax=Dallia pectoralis TaxID=75939 RepID=A0ACC2GFU1_DALPE|nr:hypothetical protein DPEC_G00158620 [Dallia pectoralis]
MVSICYLNGINTRVHHNSVNGVHMELTWDDIPVPEQHSLLFDKDLYDKYSLAPTINEIWAISQTQSSLVKSEVKEELKERRTPANLLSVQNQQGPANLPSIQNQQGPANLPSIQNQQGPANLPSIQNQQGPAELPSTQNQKYSIETRDQSSCSGVDSEDEDSDHKSGEPSVKKVFSNQNFRLPIQRADVFPVPRLPYPCISSLTRKDQRTFLNVLTSNPPRESPQNLLIRVESERSEFMRYLQDVSRMCPDDYKYISQGAAFYSEEYLKICLDLKKSCPQFYQIHEMTSLTGGTFSSRLQLSFEKQLLAMGEVLITDHSVVPDEAQLESDYQIVSSHNPPAKKVKLEHTAVSTDVNAELLSGRYEPDVVLCRESLVRLLDNHGPDFTDAWEIPVVIKADTGNGSSHNRTVYIDPPLMQTQMSVRERSRLFHEESIQLSVNKTGTKSIFHVMTESPSVYKQLPAESSQRTLMPFETSVLDFGLDLTELETFGETNLSPKRLKTQKLQKDATSQPKDATSQPKDATSQPKDATSQPKDATSQPKDATSQPNAKTCKISCFQETEEEEHEVEEEAVTSDVVEEVEPEEREPRDSHDSQDSEEFISGQGSGQWLGSDSEEFISGQGSGQWLGSDSEDERLVIDDLISPATSIRAPCPNKPLIMLPQQGAPVSLPGGAVPGTPLSPSSQRDRPSPSCLTQLPIRTRRVARKAKVPASCDQLGQILAMQKAMLKPSHCQNQTQDPATLCYSQNPDPLNSRGASRPNPYPQSLVKPCVSSYLESTQDEDTYVHAPVGSGPIDEDRITQQKRLLCEDLMRGAEDVEDYVSPEEGNLLYKLYSLQDLLLLVQSHIYLAHTRNLGTGNKMVPVHILSKMEYQLSYGVERLTNTESCRIWVEKQLHSSTVSYIGHINAHTSKIALLQKLPADWTPSASCDFRPAKSLNILHHLLKKMTGLSEGHYLIGHKAGEPFVTIFKAVEEKTTVRGVYDLQQNQMPSNPDIGPLPWIPLDHTVVLPFHQKHGQPPCTFPPPDLQHGQKAGKGMAEDPSMTKHISTSSQGVKKKKKKKKNRTMRRNQWIKKHIQRLQNNP